MGIAMSVGGIEVERRIVDAITSEITLKKLSATVADLNLEINFRTNHWLEMLSEHQFSTSALQSYL